MSIADRVLAIINRYGSCVVIDNNGRKARARAFVQPLRHKNKIYMGEQHRPEGIEKKDRYLYIGLPSVPLTENISVIETQGNKYIVKRREAYYVMNKKVYEWAILSLYGEQTEDDYESDRTTA